MAQGNTIGHEIGTGAAGGTLGGVAADFLNKGLVAPIQQQFDDMINMDRNTKLLQVNVERMRNHLQHISNMYEDQQRVIPESIRSWLGRMGDAIIEAISLIKTFQRVQGGLEELKTFQRVQGGLEELKISRQVREINTKFDNLFRDLDTDFSVLRAQNIVSFAPLRADVLIQPMPTAGLVGRAIESAATQLQTWINAVNTPPRVIGLYGMPGVGKTTVLGKVHNFYQARNVFDVVIWLTVSRDYQFSALQGQIAEAIGLDLSSISNPDIRTMMLLESLKKKEFLLILDDVWSSLVLKELGVLFGANECSKVVFSTRDRNLALTEANESTKLEALIMQEGCELFEKVAFSGRPVPENLKERARKIADECKGLPLAITVVAKAMREKKTVDDWDYCLSMMKATDPAFPNTHLCVQEELYKILRWSYKEMGETLGLQNCFLYCAMYPEDEEISVEDLVRMWIAEGFVQSKMGSYSESMKLGDRYVKLLIDRGLFESVNFEKQSKDTIKPVNVWKERFIRVHDVIRDMAIFIAGENNYFCYAGLGRTDFPIKRTRGCKRMSLRSNPLKRLPDNFPCTELVSLILSKNPLGSLPTSLTRSLTRLRVLDLSNTQIESVPTSLTDLEFLKMSHTYLKELPKDIGNLSNLQFLDLSYTQIESVPTSLPNLEFLTMRDTCIKDLPTDICNLSELQYLDISECKYLTSLPIEICQLTSLKRLHLSMGMENAVKDPRNVMALKGLTNLIELHFFLFFKFEEYEIMGDILGSWVEMKHLYLYYNHMNPSKCNLPQGMQNMKKLESLVLFHYRGTNLPDLICEFQQLERLVLDSCSTVTELPLLEKLSNLKYLKLQNYSNVRDLRIGKPSGFPKLEMLHLSEMSRVRSLGMLETGTLPNLKVLKIKKCPRLRLSTGMKNLTSLRALYGHRISWWEKLIWEDSEMKEWLRTLFKEI